MFLNIGRESIVKGLYGERSQITKITLLSLKNNKWGKLLKNLSDEGQKIETFQNFIETRRRNIAYGLSRLRKKGACKYKKGCCWMKRE